jgi:hypothetical protein
LNFIRRRFPQGYPWTLIGRGRDGGGVREIKLTNDGRDSDAERGDEGQRRTYETKDLHLGGWLLAK